MLHIVGQKVSIKSLMAALLDCSPSSSCLLLREYWNLIPNNISVPIKKTDIAAIQDLVLTFCPTMCFVPRRKLKLLMPECKYGRPLGRPGSTCAKASLVRPHVWFDNASFECESIEFLLCSRSVQCFFDMVTSCCVPERNQKGKKTSTGEKVSFFEFPPSPLRKKQWIHAIRHEEGKQFKIVDGTKVCLLHFSREDLRKSYNGRAYVVAGGIPSSFPEENKRNCLRRHPRFLKPS